jgi:hypothetical protein
MSAIQVMVDANIAVRTYQEPTSAVASQALSSKTTNMLAQILMNVLLTPHVVMETAAKIQLGGIFVLVLSDFGSQMTEKHVLMWMNVQKIHMLV